MKKILFLCLLIFLGCSNKKFVFVPTNHKCVKNESVSIGIKEVTLPYYMKDLEILELNEHILKDTNLYISKEPINIVSTKLSNALCNSKVFLYPWDGDAKYKVDIKIDDFYLKDDKLYMHARVYINSKVKKVNFSEKCKNYNCINDAFDAIVNAIIKDIK